MLRRSDIDRILMTMLRSHKGTSDLNFTPGRPLQVEASGKLVAVPIQPAIEELTPFQTEMMALGLIGGDHNAIGTLVEKGSCDLAYQVPGKARFRVNIFQQRKQVSMVLRKLETKILSLTDLGLPDIFRDMAAESNGLILVTGATGSGKSTTLAAVLNEMNETRAIHILTIEDPIEYVHPHKKATFNQRELGSDFDTFPSSLRAALRQAPKVILVGEMRDRETVELGLAAASTGHLVLSTLHSIDCGQTINRIVGMFEKEEEDQIRAKLSEVLRYVVNQRLLPKEGGGRVASQEIMGMNLRVRELVVNGEMEGKTFYDIISQSRNRGWQTHDQVLADLFIAGEITEETALAYASKRPVLMRMLDRHKQATGVEEKDELNLSLDTSIHEIKELLKNTYLAQGTYFPLRKELSEGNELICYEPKVSGSGSASQLTFAVKVNGELKGLRVTNPTGEIATTCASKGGTGPLVNFTGVNMTRITFKGEDFTQKLKAVLIDLLPSEIQLPNPDFTDAKRKAVLRIGEIGKYQHCRQLEELAQKSGNDEEIQLLNQAIQKIKERSA